METLSEILGEDDPRLVHMPAVRAVTTHGVS
jgi:hypothetical protein